MPERAPKKRIKFGYGVVDKDGHPYWDEDCVCQDRSTLQIEVVQNLNETDSSSDPDIFARRPFRVAALWRMGK